jgi:hypothetical protein
MVHVDINALEGWLTKKHSGGSFSMSTESKRWFKVKAVKGIDREEYVLGYYASQKTKEAKGFVYLQDVTNISSVGLSITLRSPARNITVTCSTPIEQRMWLEGLVQLCPLAEIDGIRAAIRLPEDREHGDEKSIEPSDAKEEHREENGVQAMQEKEEVALPKRALSPARTELKSMRSRNEPDASLDECSLSGSRVSANRERDSRDREDHRLTGFHPGAGSGTTTRLHQHINSEGRGSSGSVVRRLGEEEHSGKMPPQEQPQQDGRPSRTKSDTPSSLHTSRTEWFQGGEVHLSGDSRAPAIDRNDSARSEDGVPGIDDIDDLGDVVEQREQETDDRGEDPHSSVPPEGSVLPQIMARTSLAAADAKETRQRQSIDDLLALDCGGGLRNSFGAQRKGYDSDSDGNDGGLDLAKEKQRLADMKARGEAKANIVTGGSGQKQGAPTPSPRSLALDYCSHNSTPLTGRSRSNSILEQHLIEREARSSVYPSTQPQPPSEEKPPYAQKITPTSSTTPSITTATEADTKQDSSSTQAKAVPQEAKLSSDQLARFGLGQGVVADDNWLEDDFDA